MPSRIRIGPDGGPYVIVEENNGDLDITTPDDTIDLQNSGLINAALSGVLDAQNNDISNVGALTADLVSTDDASIDRLYGAKTKRLVDSWTRDSINPDDATYWNIEGEGGDANHQITVSGETGDPYQLQMNFLGANEGVVSEKSQHDLPYYPQIGDIVHLPIYVDSYADANDVAVQIGKGFSDSYEIRFGTRIGGLGVFSVVNGSTSQTYLDDAVDFSTDTDTNYLLTLDMRSDSYRVTLHRLNGDTSTLVADSGELTSQVQSGAGEYIRLACFAAGAGSPWDEYRFGPINVERQL